MYYKKKYKEAIANARQEYNTTENVERKQWLEELFPELAESEDERIRKELLSWLKNCDGQTLPIIVDNSSRLLTMHDIIEKYESVKIMSAEESLVISSKEYNRIVDKCFEDESEDKKQWSEEDEKHLKTLDTILLDDEEIGEKVYTEMVRWLESLKQRIGG